MPPNAAQLADYWEGERRKSERILKNFVRDHPNWFGIAVYTATKTAMDLGAGMVDVLRLGQDAGRVWDTEGNAMGKLRAAGSEGLRVLSLAGPLGRGARIFRQASRNRIARLIVDQGGGRCGYVSATRALTQTGQRAFASVDDLCRAMGTRGFGGSNLADRIRTLRQFGARVRDPVAVESMEAVKHAVRQDGSVAMLKMWVKVTERSGVTRDIQHAINAYRDTLGRFRLMDDSTARTFASLKDLCEHLRRTGGYRHVDMIPGEMALAENLFVRFYGTLEKACLALPVQLGIAGEAEVVARFEDYKQHADGAPHPPAPAPAAASRPGPGHPRAALPPGRAVDHAVLRRHPGDTLATMDFPPPAANDIKGQAVYQVLRERYGGQPLQREWNRWARTRSQWDRR